MIPVTGTVKLATFRNTTNVPFGSPSTASAVWKNDVLELLHAHACARKVRQQSSLQSASADSSIPHSMQCNQLAFPHLRCKVLCYLYQPCCNLSAITGLQLRCNLQAMRGQDISVEHQTGQRHARNQAPVMQELPDRPTTTRGPDDR